MKHSKFFYPLFFLLCLFLATCSQGTGPVDSGAPPLIGPNGGTATSADGKASVQIPAGALSTEQSITVNTVSPSAFGNIGNAYEFGPDATTFNIPSTISILYDASDLPPGLNATTLRLGKQVNGLWEVVPGSSVDIATNTVSGQTNSFSIYGIVVNTPPIANAGPGQTVKVTDTVQLSGERATDADGDPLTFAWSFVSVPEGSNATLSDSTLFNPTFVVDLPGNYTLELIVNDGVEPSAVDTVIITTENSAPVANAGPDQTVFVGDIAQLDGSASSDVDGDTLTYAWNFNAVPIGSSPTLSGVTIVNPSFTPDFPGAYTVHLLVSDGEFVSEIDIVIVSTKNSAPVANAGPDQSAFLSDVVQLDGSGSTDVDGDSLTFTWSLPIIPSGSAASLPDPGANPPTFTVDLHGTYVAQLIVNDGQEDSIPDTVTNDAQYEACRKCRFGSSCGYW